MREVELLCYVPAWERLRIRTCMHWKKEYQQGLVMPTLPNYVKEQ